MSESDTFLARWLRLKQAAAQTITPATPVDLASLPPIDSLTSESDLTVFLQPGVPTELVRAALRSTWSIDPSIRDFVGIAESQWDFNDPNAMPGFGPLAPIEGAPDIVMRSAAPFAPGKEEDFEGSPDPNPHRDGQLDPVWLSAETSRQGPQGTTDSPRSATPAAGDVQGAPRRHGSALPKPP
jgi:Protein of unknown function (DUF3306)